MRCSVFLTCVFTVVSCVVFAGPKDARDYDLSRVSTNLKKLHKVTDRPHPMNELAILDCRAPATITPHNLHQGSPSAAWCHVYVNEIARKTMLSGKGIYPVGSLIVKSKLPSKDKPDDIELFTVMRKMTDQYDPKHGNWEYAIVDGESRRIFASGKIDSCINCHQNYTETDYVTRAYLRKPD